MTTHKPNDDATYTPESTYPPQELQQGLQQDFEKLAAEDEKKGKKKDKSGKTYTEDVNDPAYVEPRLREGWTPDQPG